MRFIVWIGSTIVDKRNNTILNCSFTRLVSIIQIYNFTAINKHLRLSGEDGWGKDPFNTENQQKC